MATTMTLKPVKKQGDRTSGGSDILLLTIDWLSDASGDNSVSTANFNFMQKAISKYIQGRELNIGETSPGSVTPTAYGITVLNDIGQDLFGGNLLARSTTAAESSYTYDGTVYGSRPVDGDLTIVVSDAGNAKTGKLILTFE